MVMLARQADDGTLDHGVGIDPVVVPWSAACLAVVAAIPLLNRRRMSSAAGSLLLAALVAATAWSVVILPFDALRLVGLVPLPLGRGSWRVSESSSEGGGTGATGGTTACRTLIGLS
jgi:hypothetical protein